MEIRELVKKAFQRDLSDPSALNDAFDCWSQKLLRWRMSGTRKCGGCLRNSPQNKKASVCSS